MEKEETAELVTGKDEEGGEEEQGKAGFEDTPSPPSGEEAGEDGEAEEPQQEEEDERVLGQHLEELKGAEREQLQTEGGEEDVPHELRYRYIPASLAERARTLQPTTPENKRLLDVFIALCAIIIGVYVYVIAFPRQPASIFSETPNQSILEATSAIKAENAALRDGLANLREINIDPIKIKGKEGARARELRQTLHRIISENEDMRLAVGRLWLTEQTPTTQERAAFTEAVTENHRLRVQTQKLRHLGVDVQDLQNSLAELRQENDDLKVAYAEFKYQRVPLPKELAGVSREVEGLAQQVNDAERKRKPPPNLYNARNYANFMGQVLSTMSSLHEFGEASAFGKLDIASDVFTEIAPKASSVPPAVEQKLRQGRAKFEELKQSLAAKWSQLKALSEPENIKAVGRDTLTKMNRVLVNVVGKMKEIAHATLLKRGQTPVDKTASALSDKLTVLDSHFDKTWNELENEVDLTAVDARLAREMRVDDGSSLARGDGEQQGEATVTEGSNVPSVGNQTEASAAGRISTPESNKTAGITVTVSPKKSSDREKANAEAKKEKEKKELKRLREQKKKEEQKNQRAKKLREKKRKESKKKEDKEKKYKDKSSKRAKEEKQKLTSKSRDEKSEKKSSESGKYFKGHYNKDKGKTRVPDAKSRFRKVKDDDDDDDDDEKPAEKRQSRLERHWERPSKKNSFRSFNVSRNQFIRRKGEAGKTKVGDWVSARSQERSKRRVEGKKSDWVFDRAQARGRSRRTGTQAEWQFSRASLRKRLREAQKELKQKQKEKRNLRTGYTDTWRTLKRAAHRRRGNDDDDDDDDDDYDYYGRNSKFVKRDTLDLGSVRNQRRRPQFRNR